MTDADRLAAIKQLEPESLHLAEWCALAKQLAAEVERQAQQIRDLHDNVSLLAKQQQEAFGIADELDQAHAEIERLRGLLAQLEWASHKTRGGFEAGSRLQVLLCCPVCEASQGFPHRDCWLAAELHRGTS